MLATSAYRSEGTALLLQTVTTAIGVTAYTESDAYLEDRSRFVFLKDGVEVAIAWQHTRPKNRLTVRDDRNDRVKINSLH